MLTTLGYVIKSITRIALGIIFSPLYAFCYCGKWGEKLASIPETLLCSVLPNIQIANLILDHTKKYQESIK